MYLFSTKEYLFSYTIQGGQKKQKGNLLPQKPRNNNSDKYLNRRVYIN